MFMLTALIGMMALYIILVLVRVLQVLEQNSAVGHAWSGESEERFWNAAA